MSQVKPSQSYIDQERASVLLEKWAPVLDYSSDNVKAIADDHSRLNTAILLENQESWCLNENSYGGNALGANGSFGQLRGASTANGGDIYAQGDDRLPKILILMIRRTFPELITNEIVGVQPMSGPVGLAFAMRYKYENESLGTGIDGKTPAAAGGRHTYGEDDNGEALIRRPGPEGCFSQSGMPHERDPCGIDCRIRFQIIHDPTQSPGPGRDRPPGIGSNLPIR